jgi:hypothetical protein
VLGSAGSITHLPIKKPAQEQSCHIETTQIKKGTRNIKAKIADINKNTKKAI